MSKIYLEAREISSDPMSNGEGEFIRMEVTDNTEVERQSILADLKAIMQGVNCKFQKHTCGHEDKQPCKVENV